MTKIKVRAITNDKHDKKCAKVVEQILNSPWVQIEIEHLVHEYRKKVARQMVERYKCLAPFDMIDIRKIVTESMAK